MNGTPDHDRSTDPTARGGQGADAAPASGAAREEVPGPLQVARPALPQPDRTAARVDAVGRPAGDAEEDAYRPSVRRAPPPPDEPKLRLPTGPILCMALIGAVGVAAVWVALGAMFLRPGWDQAGLLAGLVTVTAAALSTLATVPWIPKPASTAGLVWIAGTALRGVATAALGFLLYSAPPFGWSEDLAKGAAPFLLAVATGYLVVLILEVAVIARHVLRATAP